MMALELGTVQDAGAFETRANGDLASVMLSKA